MPAVISENSACLLAPVLARGTALQEKEAATGQK